MVQDPLLRVATYKKVSKSEKMEMNVYRVKRGLPESTAGYLAMCSLIQMKSLKSDKNEKYCDPSLEC